MRDNTEIPQTRTNKNDIIIKVLRAITKGVGQDVEPFQTCNGIFNQTPNSPHRLIVLFLLDRQVWVRILLTFARLFVRDTNIISLIIRLNTLKTQVNQQGYPLKPGKLRWESLFEY